MVNTIGKLFERLVKRRLETHLLKIPEGLSKNQFGFRRGRSTIDAIEKVLTIVNHNEAKPWRRKKLRALVSIYVVNAFNTVPWDKIGDALRRKHTIISRTAPKGLLPGETATDGHRRYRCHKWGTTRFGHRSYSLEYILR